MLGHRSAHGITFAGIPYAPTPVGTGRFAAPGPRWDGVRGAARTTAPQRPGPLGRADLSPVLGTTTAPGDYLSLTVSTPDPGTRNLPLLVFLHGGGFATGTGPAPVYATGAFPRDGVVLVTVNYRLGAIGWLDLPGAPANRGLLDVLAALEWINANITNFGGNPGNVTVGGQSERSRPVLPPARAHRGHHASVRGSQRKPGHLHVRFPLALTGVRRPPRGVSLRRAALRLRLCRSSRPARRTRAARPRRITRRSRPNHPQRVGFLHRPGKPRLGRARPTPDRPSITPCVSAGVPPHPATPS
ncbi:carboxylesterase family protein [Amycolatopsis carbonis]|uniref:Carboxylesterase family protein n=1 Tax=Amycolatopsis carbonis TaxID=715471 RepID=A0A9Y2MXR8_9PSEU|nr:carboxylesterase family protein [Amycolatopsis sp. 2-15]WIX82616.1 carboxylesterase family protein [Amycolatopsis sp. 2-15]